MDSGVKYIEPNQHPVDNNVDGIDLKDHGLQKDWSDLEERQAKRKFVSSLNAQSCHKNYGLRSGDSNRSLPAGRSSQLFDGSSQPHVLYSIL